MSRRRDGGERLSIQVRAGVEPLELYSWWEQPRGRRRTGPLPLGDARHLVGRLARSGQGPLLRRLAAAHGPVAGLDDGAVFDLLSRWLASGTVRLASAPLPPLQGKDLERGEEALPPE